MMESNPNKEVARFFGHASWVICLCGWLIAAAIGQSYGREWGLGLIAGFKAFSVSTSLAFVCSMISLWKNVSWLGLTCAVISLMLLTPLLTFLFSAWGRM